MTREWTDEELADLEDPDTWDWDSAEVLPASPEEARGVFSVEYTVAEITAMEVEATRLGMILTTNIRESARTRPSAPMLLAALQALVRYFENPSMLSALPDAGESLKPKLEQAHAAIAAATAPTETGAA